ILRSFLVNVFFKFFNVGQSKSLLSTRLSWRFACHLVVPVLCATHERRVVFAARCEVVRARRGSKLTVETDVLTRLRPAQLVVFTDGCDQMRALFDSLVCDRPVRVRPRTIRELDTD